MEIMISYLPHSVLFRTNELRINTNVSWYDHKVVQLTDMYSPCMRGKDVYYQI